MRNHCSFPRACRHWYVLVLHRIAVEGALHFNIFTLNSQAGLFSESLLMGVKRWVARSLFLSAPVKAVERYDSLFSELSVPCCPQQPDGSMDCGAYVTLFARTLYDALDDLTETSLVDCLRNLGSDSEVHARVLNLRDGMRTDLRTAAPYFGQNKEALQDFGSGVEHAKYALQQLGGRMQASNLRGAAL